MAPTPRPPRREPGAGPRRAGGPPRTGSGTPAARGGGRGRDGDQRGDRPTGTGGGPRRSGSPRGTDDGARRGGPRRDDDRRGAPPARGRSEDRPARGRSDDERPARRSPAAPPADARTSKWGGVARRGARNLEDPAPGSAAEAWRKAADEADRQRTKARGARTPEEREEWVDSGPVRDEAAKAVARGASPAPAAPRRRKKEVPAEVAEEVAKAAGPNWAARVKDRLADAARAYEAERYRDARRILEQLLERAPSAVAVRELLGLTYYRMGKWRDAIRELGAIELLSGSVDHHPVIADCHRALRQFDRVEELWDELRRTGASVEVLIEGRIVTAGALADQKRLGEAIKVLEQGPVDVRKPQEHHLRLWYALASLYEQAGDVPRARSLFIRLAMADPEFADVIDRVEALGG